MAFRKEPFTGVRWNHYLMSKKSTQTSATLITLLAQSAPSPGRLYANLYRAMRQTILDGHLPSGSRLPSTRTLASDLDLSRNTVESAYAQLEAEGFTERRVGSGTYVRPTAILAKDSFRHARAPRRVLDPKEVFSRRGNMIRLTGGCFEPSVIRPFSGGMPALDAFPIELWQRLCSRRLRSLRGDALGYAKPQGEEKLRTAIAQYVATARGVKCSKDQVLILTSSQQGLELCARLLTDPGDSVWLENPGYLGARNAFVAAGAKIVPVPVDTDGLQVSVGIKRGPKARLAYVTPSHQYPTGVTLTLERRTKLLEWAALAKAWIIEDDYDSEFRYSGHPIAAIHGLGSEERVIYIGTFSKVMFPGLRIAYIILPPSLIDSFVVARTVLDGHTPAFFQSVLADFMDDGHFAAHVRRMRVLYRARRDFLLELAQESLFKWLAFGSSNGGLQIVAYAKSAIADEHLSNKAMRLGLDLPPLSKLYVSGTPRQGWILGFAALTPERISSGSYLFSKVLRGR
jgi:GntR family transcriptional regulator / MocR family aminotransferase